MNKWGRRWLMSLRWLVPRALRDDWQREWEAELRHREQELEAWNSPEATSNNRTHVLGALRDAWWLRAQSVREGVWLDFRLAARSLVRQRWGSLLVAAVVGGSVAATVIVFALVDSILLRPLPYPNASQLVQVFQLHPSAAPESKAASRADLATLRESNGSFSGIAGWYVAPRTMRADGVAEVLSVAQVSADFFSILGVSPSIGRAFSAEETIASKFNSANAPQASDPVVVLSYGLWQRGFAGDATIVGATIEMERKTWRVLGVMPEGFAFPDREVEAWIPWSFDGARYRDQRYLSGLARLDQSVSMASARDELRVLGDDLAVRFPDSNQGWQFGLEPLEASTVGGAATSLSASAIAVLAVLLLAVLDVGLLQWVRSQSLMNGYVIRRALGASRRRVFHTMVVEMGLPALLGGLLGGAVSFVTVRWLASTTPQWTGLPRLDELSWTSRTSGFWLGCMAAVALLTALAPALRAFRLRAGADAARSNSRGTANRTLVRALALLVVAEIAVASSLVAGSGLLLRSWWQLLHVDPGFSAEHVVVAPMILDNQAYDGAKSRQFHEALRQRIAHLPGVESVGSSTVLPMAPIGPDFARPVIAKGASMIAEEGPQADVRMATPGLFGTLAIPLLQGRDFIGSDGPDAEKVVLLNAELAEQLFAGGVAEAVGSEVVIDYSEYDYPARVIGVVGNVLQSGLQGEVRPSIYIPHAQRPYLMMNLAVRLDPKTPPSMAQLQQAILELDPGQPPHSLTRLSALVSRSIDRERLTGGLVSVFGLTALLLAMLGLYGVLAAAVSARRQELALRLALGACPRDLEGLVLRRSAALFAVGMTLGLLLTLGFGRLLSGVLYGTSPVDPAALAVSGLALGMTMFLASWIPARRAGRTAPLRALNGYSSG